MKMEVYGVLNSFNMKNRLLVYGIGVLITFALLFGFNYDKVKEKHNAEEADKKTAEVVSKKQDGKIPFPETDEDIEEYKLYIQGKIQYLITKKPDLLSEKIEQEREEVKTILNALATDTILEKIKPEDENETKRFYFTLKYLFFNEFLRWGDTFLPLIVPTFFANAFDVFLLRQFFRTIPEEMCDAARVDGASEFQIFTRIILPLSTPVLATVSVFTFLWAWNDFLGPLIYLQSPRNFTMALGLQDFQGQHIVAWNLLMAASVIFTVPIIVAFFFAQRTFIQGIKLTGSKA